MAGYYLPYLDKAKYWQEHGLSGAEGTRGS